ncbi:MAG: chemotaxis response regulator protein-glutamate methylesterase [Roseburia sp.]|nr:chemotaxis response regulator protein-glutamate methylesterase [Roseburia sp.]
MKKNILVVDDSALMRRVICDIINTDSTFQATDVCRDGLEAYEKLKKNKYDGVVLDINMPRMNGLELLERLQKERIKATVIMVSTMTTKDAEVTILAMELGAIDFVTKPDNVIEAKGDKFKKRLLEVLNAVLKTEQFRRTSSITAGVSTRPAVSAPVRSTTTRSAVNNVKSRNKIVALACSTGGPKALQSVIPFLPKNLDAPMVLVQHMPAGFTKSMADRLNETSAIKVKEAEDGDVLQKGVVYVAPGGKHMEVKKTSSGHVIALNNMPAIGGLRPCADITYDSLKQSGFDQVVCVVLTGMGADGTKGILSLEKSKPIYVISQDAESCVVYGMPKAIAEAGVVNEVVPLDKVASTITKNVGVQ